MAKVMVSFPGDFLSEVDNMPERNNAAGANYCVKPCGYISKLSEGRRLPVMTLESELR